ncbi:rRNA maturation RNase YbeY [bacterium]|nr:MAG: rRNA maturation RNase YbeY [bacterium]
MSSQLFIPEKLPLEIQQKQLKALFEAWLNHVQLDLLGGILVQFVSTEDMLELVRVHQQKDESTDVLSFNYNPPLVGESGDKIIGEIVICEDVARDNADKHKVEFGVECMTLFVHGLLHIAGKDHAGRREKEQFEADTRAIMEVGGLKPVSLWSD